MYIVCPKCSAVNNLSQEHFAQVQARQQEAICGKCATELLPTQPVALSDEVFARYISSNDMPVVVDFWAAWCGPCKMMAPEFAKAAQTMPDVIFAKVDTESAQRTAAQYNIRSIPTLAVFYKGRELARQSGAMPAAQLQQWVQSVVNAMNNPA